MTDELYSKLIKIISLAFEPYNTIMGDEVDEVIEDFKNSSFYFAFDVNLVNGKHHIDSVCFSDRELVNDNNRISSFELFWCASDGNEKVLSSHVHSLSTGTDSLMDLTFTKEEIDAIDQCFHSTSDLGGFISQYMIALSL